MYKSIETGAGDYAVIFDCDSPMLVDNGLTLDDAESLAQSMQTDLLNISFEELEATQGINLVL